KYEKANAIIRAMLNITSVTLNLENHFITIGTSQILANIMTTKNTTFLPMIKGSDTSPPPAPNKLITKASRITTTTSSTTAAPSIVEPSFELSLLSSFSVCTDILTE